MSEWREVRLIDIAEVNPKESLSKGVLASKIGMEYLKPFCKKPIDKVAELYNGGTKFRNGDTLVARITPCLENGKTAFVDILDDGEIGFGSTEYIVLRAKNNISDSHYVYYFSRSDLFREIAIASMTGSSGRQRVQIDVVKNHLFELPDIFEQKAIASVLSSLDNKIDLLHRQNKTLESMAETLFRQWFVEEAQDDWVHGTLKDEFAFTMGQSPKGSSFNEERIGTPMFQGNADFGFRFPKERVYTTEPTRFAQKLDTLISVRAPVGAQNMARSKCCIGRGVAAFRHIDNLDWYTYTYFKLRYLMDEIKKFNDEGTVFGSISKSDFEKIEVIIPPASIIHNYEIMVKPLNDKVITNCYQIEKLENLRDTLLPKLMSGEVRVNYTPEEIKQ
ncbi:restriction endonuclease subunit S [Salmonella enterica subsp. enterica serovar Gaminara]|nr:restriction endonuclease subunit S [Salmonella enterica subsp. enterica serovar Gaminara]